MWPVLQSWPVRPTSVCKWVESRWQGSHRRSTNPSLACSLGNHSFDLLRVLRSTYSRAVEGD